MKNDATLDCPRDARYCYANPYNPIICLVLTMILYLLVTPPTSDTDLFPGANQYDWYNKYLNNSLQKKTVYIKELWYYVDHIGAHSVRKGASTYMTSGCVGAPMQQAVNIRCGWRIVGVTDTYR